MRIALSGVETNNKGAELMLYAILQEIERKFPKAIVYLPYRAKWQGDGYKIYTKLDLRNNPYEKVNFLLEKYRIKRILHKLRIHKFDSMYRGEWAIPCCKYYLDASGFAISDQQSVYRGWLEGLVNQVINYSKLGTKIICLPQAVGPFEGDVARDAILIYSRLVDIFFAREEISYNYMKSVGYNMNKVLISGDFTSLVEGVFPQRYDHLRGGICIIPNSKMISSQKITFDKYIELLSLIANECKKHSRPIYLLNHEGVGDERIAYKCSKLLNDTVEVVTNINALEVKGLISSAYLCISSRFHGVVSALNSNVPCLATSWSHKYEALFNDYGQHNCILPLNDNEECMSLIKKNLQRDVNSEIRIQLSKRIPYIKEETYKMWKKVWA